MDADVLIVGAGPTGLVLALWLTLAGVKVRLIDKAPEPGQTSRALGVHARTLEFYAQLGFADEMVAAGLKAEGVRLWVRGAERARVNLGDMGAGLSPYPYMLIYPQDEHERLLIGKLTDLGVAPERPVEVIGFIESGEGISARLRGADGSETHCRARFLAGCDGARSKVRELIGAAFPGGTYSHLFYVADVEASGPVMNGDLNVALDDAEFLAIFPLAGEGRARLISTVERESDEGLTFADVSRHVIERLGVEVSKVNWFSTYRVHHRVAGSFRRGPAFLLGDAAHIHSPVGAQGLNTGVGDAVNLAWKLAEVVSRRAPAALLDTYEPERVAFARRLVATTDRIFTVVNQEGPIARFLRLGVVPNVLPRALGSQAARRLMFRTISQINISYRNGGLAEGSAGQVDGGERLPWTGANFTPLASRAWQGHVYGEAAEGVERACVRANLPLHRFAFDKAAQSAGLAKDAFHLVRPDGYVALAAATDAPAALGAYQFRHELTFG